VNRKGTDHHSSAECDSGWDLSVIIVNWNTKDLLSDCLSSIEGSTDEIVLKTFVVDNASKDGSQEMMRAVFPDFRLIESGGNLGFAKANNLARPYCKSPFVLFLNPDTLVSRGSIDKMANVLRNHPEVGAVGCKMCYPDGRVQPLGLQWFPSPGTEFVNILFLTNSMEKTLRRHLPYHDPEVNGFVRKLYGGALMVRKSALDAVGWFDERFFMYGEDVDLCRRITDGGWQLYYLSDAEIVHLRGGASRHAYSNFSTLMKCESISKLMKKHHGPRGAILYRLAMLSGAAARLAMVVILRIARRRSVLCQDVNTLQSGAKYIAILKWSLGLLKAKVAD